MKKIVWAGIMTLGFASGALADPIHGTWQTIPDDNGHYGHIEISACGAAICGTLVRAYDSAGTQLETDNIGKRMVWDMENTGGGEYDNGKVYSPDRDKTYNGEMELSGNSLTVKGCVFGICRSGGTWSRVN
ncbi:DUF2147 domain-containing protein [Halocynthiibacter namhaensis]|uniref:DUF2147 domain-containing protein n=1 Tax=Halocynthiibacter namhaensis TaxID=1290553 RepID=UPI0005795A99|nr:DUF2147 domain-containing protein [Halocynthiibacter namhaensis]